MLTFAARRCSTTRSGSKRSRSVVDRRSASRRRMGASCDFVRLGAGRQASLPRRARPRRTRDDGDRVGLASLARSAEPAGRARWTRARRRERRRHARRGTREPARPLRSRPACRHRARRARRGLRLGATLATLALVVAVTAGTLTLRSGELGFLNSWFGSEPGPAGPVRGELEPAPDLRLHRRPRLPRPAPPRHRLVRRAAAGGVRALPARTHASGSPTSRRTTSRPRTAPSSRSRRTTRSSTSSARRRRALLLVLLALAFGRRAATRLHWPRGPTAESGYIPAAWLAALARRARRRSALRRYADRHYLLADARRRRRGRSVILRARMNAPAKLTIVHAIARLNVGGAALHVLQLAREQQRRGHDVSSSRARSPPGEESMEYRRRRARRLDPAACPTLQRELSPRADVAAILELRKILRARRPDVLHTHTAEGGCDGPDRRHARRRSAPARRRPHVPRPRAERLLRLAAGARLPSGRARARPRDRRADRGQRRGARRPGRLRRRSRRQVRRRAVRVRPAARGATTTTQPATGVARELGAATAASSSAGPAA